jgi:mycobactin lysine-N-oxygenase
MWLKRIAVIGGGAKAAALAAKAASLREAAGLPIDVVIFERAQIGANWNGAHGYTDGDQSLCTPAERDLGFPYSHRRLGQSVAEHMQAFFSWSAFLVERQAYRDWVDRGRPRPSHRQFADYLAFCIDRAKTEVCYGKVLALKPDGARWSVVYEDRDTGTEQTERAFDGVVVTGTGPADRLSTFTDRRLFDGHSFWSGLDAVPGMAEGAPASPVVIMGSGGTAAACAGWLVRAGVSNDIVIMGRRPTLFARTNSAFENRAFLDEEIWASLSVGDRRQFTDRLTRSAVWESVLDELSRARNVVVRPGDVKAIRNEPPGDPDGELFLEYTTSAEPDTIKHQPAALAIDATGFDAWWFADLLPSDLADQMRADREGMMSRMGNDLALPLPGPALHAPAVSQVVGPSFSSLMALGQMSDAVLSPYVTQLVSPR